MDERGQASPSRKFFGARAVDRGYATEIQILTGLRAQYSAQVLFGKHFFLGEILLLQGVLTPHQLTDLLHETGERHEEPEDVVSRRFFGDVAIEMGLATPTQVFEALNEQATEEGRGERRRLIGEILFAKGVIAAKDLDRILEKLITPAKKRKPA
jgi:hypothetical protein